MKRVSELLRASRTIAVVGLSSKRFRPSYGVAEYLQHNGYRIIPVNPNLREAVLGEEPCASLRDITVPVDIVNVFRRSEFVPEIVEQAIQLGPAAIWMQEGVSHEAAAATGARGRLAGDRQEQGLETPGVTTNAIRSSCIK